MITFRDNKKIVISFFARGDIMLGKSHTAYDVMKEYLLTRAELCGKYDFPALYSSVNIPGNDTIDFENSFGRKIKNHRDFTVNFYIDDMKFQRIWNNPDKYIEHNQKGGPNWGSATREYTCSLNDEPCAHIHQNYYVRIRPVFGKYRGRWSKVAICKGDLNENSSK